MTFRTSPPNHPLAPRGRSERQFRYVTFGKIGVRGFYIIMRARHERVNFCHQLRCWGLYKLQADPGNGPCQRKVLAEYITTTTYIKATKSPHTCSNHQLRFRCTVLHIRSKSKSATFGRAMTPYVHRFTCDSDDCVRSSLQVFACMGALTLQVVESKYVGEGLPQPLSHLAEFLSWGCCLM